MIEPKILEESTREPFCKCQHCGKELYIWSCGNFRQNADGAWEGICLPCLPDEED